MEGMEMQAHEMSAEELRAIMERLEIQQVELARWLGERGWVVRSYVNGGAKMTRKVPASLAILARFLDVREEFMLIVQRIAARGGFAMSAAKLKEITEQLGVLQKELAAWLGIKERAARRYMNEGDGQRSVPPALALLMHTLNEREEQLATVRKIVFGSEAPPVFEAPAQKRHKSVPLRAETGRISVQLNPARIEAQRVARAEKAKGDAALLEQHRRVLAALAAEGESGPIRAEALRQIALWESRQLCWSGYVAEWRRILDLPAAERAAAVLREDDEGVALRQNTPFILAEEGAAA